MSDSLDFRYVCEDGLVIEFTVDIEKGIEDIANGLRTVLNAAGWQLSQLEIVEIIHEPPIHAGE